MSVRRLSGKLKTWVEIDSRALRRNRELFERLIGGNARLWAVVKSNAYGHGLIETATILAKDGVRGFCVDSVAEGIALRKSGIKRHIFVLGPTLPSLFREAEAHELVLTIGSYESLRALVRERKPPFFEIKVDTGMHRQGVGIEEIPKILSLIRRTKREEYCEGAYTHFASAKDPLYPTLTEQQFLSFEKAIELFKKGGYKDSLFHASATGGAFMNSRYHLGAVRIGMGLYGYFPSEEVARHFPHIKLHPVLRWRAVVSEVKSIKKGDAVGYDASERVSRPTKIAIIPVGYWHGLPRSASSRGVVLIHGKRAKVIGRVSMDMIVVDVTGIAVRLGDIATLIGTDGGDSISAVEFGMHAGISHYEALARLNPLMARIVA